MAKDVLAKVDQMKPKREYILSKLNEAMLYPSFRGNCQYLQSD
jgi:hypothetical protein